MNPLEEIGEKYQPTKRRLGYLLYYWRHFRDIREAVRNVLEIGVQSGRSLKMWEEFFPNATIYGLDIDPACRAAEGGRRRVFIGDQSDDEVLGGILQAADGPIEIVVDDGSHQVLHQIATFRYLFPRMSDHGIYAVEDMGPPVGDWALDTPNHFKKLVDNLMYWPPKIHPENWPYMREFPESASWADRNVVGVCFYRYIAFLMRGHNPGDNPHLRPDETAVPPVSRPRSLARQALRLARQYLPRPIRTRLRTDLLPQRWARRL